MASPSEGPLERLIREIHRRSLWQVLGIYVVASWIVLQVIDTLEGMVTLPEWFAGLAIGFLVLVKSRFVCKSGGSSSRLGFGRPPVSGGVRGQCVVRRP